MPIKLSPAEFRRVAAKLAASRMTTRTLRAAIRESTAGAIAKARRALKPATVARRLNRANEWQRDMAMACWPESVWLSLHVRNRANGGHGNRYAIARERRAARTLARDAVEVSRACRDAPKSLPVHVTIVRYGAGTMDEDGLLNSLKSVRDGVADAYGVKDNDPRISFEYDQKTAPQHCHGVRVEFSRPRTSQRRKGKK